MLRKMRSFEYLEAASVSEAVSFLDRYRDKARIFAGGTDLLVAMKETGQSPEYLIDIKSIPGLSSITYDEKEGLRIGTCATIREIETSRVVQEKFPPLAQGAQVLGSVQIRNRGTIGGNLCTASPSADTAPPLLVLDAKVKLVGPKGERVLPLDQFFVGPGMTVLENELLTEVIVPPPAPDTRGVYLYIMRRRAVDLALVGVAASAAGTGKNGTWKDVRIALGAVAPTPIRARKAEAVLEGRKKEARLIAEAARIASEQDACCITDVRASEWYRKELVRVLTQRALQQVS